MISSNWISRFIAPAAGALLLLLAGCLSTISTYYAVQEGKSRSAGGRCSMDIRREALVYASRNAEVSIEAISGNAESQRPLFILKVLVAAGHQVRLLSSDVRVRYDHVDGKEAASVLFFYYPHLENGQQTSEPIDARRPLTGLDPKQTGSTRTSYGSQLPLERATQEIEIQLPDLAVDGEIVKPPPVRFGSKRGLHLIALCQ